MIFIWGFRSRASKVSEGEFFCPKEGADRHYLLQRFRRWFTFFFIPVFPVGAPKGEVVKCRSCGTAFSPAVLNAPTSAVLTDSIRDTMRTAAVLILKAGNPSDPSSRRAAVETIAANGAVGYDDSNLDHDLYRLDAGQLPDQLGQLVRGFNDHGKETFLSQLARIGAADGSLSDPERSVLDTVGSALGLSAAHVLGIVTSVVKAPRPS